MTSKNSCFDRAIFRRSLRRTAPVWGLFCLYELLLPLRLYSYCRGVSVCTEDFFVQAERTILENAVTGASVVPFVYGGLLAWALFSWLFRTNSAYFYAALPVRRRTLFLTNYLTGLLLCAAPALVSSLLLWAVGAGFGVSAFLPAMQVLAATAMEYAVHWGYERLFQVQFWDYSSTKCDVNGRICLPFSICWGILSMLAVRYVQPVLEGYAALLPEWAAALAVFLVTLDGILTARVLLTTHDIDALTPRTLLQSKRRRTA